MFYEHEVILSMQAFTWCPSEQVEHPDMEIYVEYLHDILVRIHDLARQNLGSATKYQKWYFDRMRKVAPSSKANLYGFMIQLGMLELVLN